MNECSFGGMAAPASLPPEIATEQDDSARIIL